MAERLKAHVLKTCLGHTNVGSNPTPSAEGCMLEYQRFEGSLAQVATPKLETFKLNKRGGARVAEWARLLSE